MDYKKLSDIKLFEYCQEDDLKAYGELFDRYIPKLYRVGKRYFDDQYLIEELAADVLFDIWQRRKTIVIEKSVSNFLFKAIHFQCLKHLRKKVPLHVDIHAIDESRLISCDIPDDALHSADVIKAYRKTLYKLSPQRRKAFELSRENSMSYAEIAQEMDISKHTVEGHISAALKILRSSLKSFGTYLFAFLLLIS
ncbi:RNA polymerase sigma-70 factor [Sphingobacterium haloxyli]|uniref:RNA polymerase sigma-70 factor n=1 Tax=Sphingobacterium haloxyli TaxID=2100533 RepID=UPI0013FD62D0|nr:RNA polymerase sigma-70 factor [Sphingobacterium haloxyli]